MARSRSFSHGAAPHGFDSQFYIAPSRHHNYGETAVDSDDFGKKVQSLLTRRRVPCVVQINEDGIVIL
jgi:hypothetical protein